jgi:hypothetical protein
MTEAYRIEKNGVLGDLRNGVSSAAFVSQQSGQ